MRARSAMAAASMSACACRLTHRYADLAATASAASAIPSSTRCGVRASSDASLALAGSDSMPFATTTAPRSPARSRTALSLGPAG